MRAVLLLLLLLPLTACTRSVTYAERMQTAQIARCWPGDPTPPPQITVTPIGFPTVLPSRYTPGPGTPTPTALPTTTALPRCTPAPGETLAPWPTPIPPPPAHPTLEGRAWQGGSGPETVFQLPNAALVLDLAVHPTDHWPVAAAIDVPITNQGQPRVYVRAWSPQTHAWGLAQTVDTDTSHPGQHVRSVAVGITGDDRIYAAWSASAYPDLGLFVAMSSNYGSTWTAPQRLGTGFGDVLDLATTVDGQVAVLALTRSEPPRAVLLVQQTGGAWQQRALDVPVWAGSTGSLALVPAEGQVWAVALLGGPNDGSGTVWLLRQALTTPAFALASRRLPGAGERLASRARSLVFAQGRDRPPGIAFVFGERDASSWYALVSRDAGRSWGELEPIVATGLTNVAPPFGGVAADPQADRLVSVWTCCTDATWGNVAATHYGSWRDGAGTWHPAPDTPANTRIPVITGATSAGLTVLAQAANTRFAWLAFVEDGQQVIVQSVDLNTLIPTDQYPTATPFVTVTPTPTARRTP
jgi:hypothetical protein